MWGGFGFGSRLLCYSFIGKLSFFTYCFKSVILNLKNARPYGARLFNKFAGSLLVGDDDIDILGMSK